MKKRDIREFLHLYLGCECEVVGGVAVGPLISVGNYGFCTVTTGEMGDQYFKYEEVKPILRPLSDMTEEETKFICGWVQAEREVLHFRKTKTFAEVSYRWKDTRMVDGYAYSSIAIYFNKEDYTPDQFRYLLSRGFDLFNLIDEGLAVDKTKVDILHP